MPGAPLTATVSISLIQTFLQATQTFKPPASDILSPPPQGAGQGGPGHAWWCWNKHWNYIQLTLYVWYCKSLSRIYCVSCSNIRFLDIETMSDNFNCPSTFEMRETLLFVTASHGEKRGMHEVTSSIHTHIQIISSLTQSKLWMKPAVDVFESVVMLVVMAHAVLTPYMTNWDVMKPMRPSASMSPGLTANFVLLWSLRHAQ